MKIAYVANIRLPTEKAHGVQIMKMCEAFAALGHNVELIVTDRNSPIQQDPFIYYGVERTFNITRLHVVDTVEYGAVGFLFESWTFSRSAKRYLADKKFDLVFGRDEHVLARLLKLQTPVYWETHTGTWNRDAQTLARAAAKIVAISNGIKNLYIKRGVKADRIIVAHDGIDLDAFANPESKEAARQRLGLPLDKKIAMYIGRLDGWKGTDTLLEASKLLPPEWLVAIIGGEPAQVNAFSKQYPTVKFLGYRPYTELPDNQASADVLVLPNTGKDVISRTYTSPLKLFAYMASNRPIVASDLPSIREVVDENSAALVPPDDCVALAKAVEDAHNRKDLCRRAVELVSNYSWQSRAQVILN